MMGTHPSESRRSITKHSEGIRREAPRVWGGPEGTKSLTRAFKSPLKPGDPDLLLPDVLLQNVTHAHSQC